jgi:hypothetical protein
MPTVSSPKSPWPRLSAPTTSDQQRAAAIYAHSAGMYKNDGLIRELGNAYQEIDDKFVGFQSKIYDCDACICDHQRRLLIARIRDLLPATLIEVAHEKMLQLGPGVGYAQADVAQIGYAAGSLYSQHQ